MGGHMTKTERLLYIIDLFRVRKSISLAELTEECRVSKRTVYRDLLSLSDMDIPIYYDNGYRLAKKISLPALNFTEFEQELIGLSLKCSPLFSSPRVSRMIKNIELKILSAIPNKKDKQLNRFIALNESAVGRMGNKYRKIIFTFAEAYFCRSNVNIIRKRGKKKMHNLKPVQMNISGKTGLLIFSDASGKKIYEVSLDEIESVSLSGKRTGR